MRDNEIPSYLRKAQEDYDRLADDFKFLQSVQPIPVFDIEDVGYDLDQADDRLLRAKISYQSTRKTCCKCRVGLRADGDDMRCPKCGEVYYPEFEFDPIPF